MLQWNWVNCNSRKYCPFYFLEWKISRQWRKFCSFTYVGSSNNQRYFHLPSWKKKPSNWVVWQTLYIMQVLASVLKSTNLTAMQFTKIRNKVTLVPLEWWRPCLHADLPASSSLHTVCDIAEKIKHLSEFRWSTMAVIKNIADKSGLVTALISLKL